ncbi:MAG: gamma-aminobutyrate dehydratase [Candidatus Tectomicrobia bacterium]|uniref:Gamma-aminobutyrate dehydratase n=1 Tax=Tectimicrobiota bacterium TaxID=2528274 RepID=A0A932GQ98_UNCTE|nr:gamma-aminobutyrate dehydratase [Candidatus Tectomicrobia bacterium]
MRSPSEYRQSLRDGRKIHYRGARVEDVTIHPALRIAVDHAAIDYEMAEDPSTRDLATVSLPDGRRISRYYHIPGSAQDLRDRSTLIEKATARGGTLVVLIKEIGTDALFALHIVASQMDRLLGTGYLKRVESFCSRCRDQDLALAVAQTDVKGDRSLSPSEQDHPDYYVHKVRETSEGIVVRGAKIHTSVSVNANEIIVLPTRALQEKDRDYAVAFALPVATPGLTLIASPYGDSPKNAFEHPISSRHKMVETLTVFDDVFVPWERVFLNGEWQHAGVLAKAFVEFHRFTAVSYKLPLVDLLVGCGQLLSEINGIERAGHVREKMTWLVAYAETLRALTRMAAHECRVLDPGVAVPSVLLVNLAKWHFASNYHRAVSLVQDLSGGLLVTGPGEEDVQAPEVGDYIRKFLGGRKGVSAETRLKAMNLVRDLTASEFGGYQEVLAVHAEGSIEAEKLTIYREADVRRCRALAMQLAGINEEIK